MRRLFFNALLFFLTIGITEAEQKKPKFAHFLEPGFPFAEITVDARELGEGFPKNNLTPRGLVVRLAEDTYIAYDTDLCRVACAWSGGFLTEESLATMSYQKAKKKKGGGQKKLPSPVGKPIFANGLYPGVQLGAEPQLQDPRPSSKQTSEVGRGQLPAGMARWKSVSGSGSILYEIDGIVIMEDPWKESEHVIGRRILLDHKLQRPLVFTLGTGHCKIIAPPAGTSLGQKDGINYLTVKGNSDDSVQWIYLLQSDRPIPPNAGGNRPIGFSASAGALWPDHITTKGKISTADEPYVIDEIELPIKNTNRRNVRPSAIDFFPDGRAAILTFDGDVWIASGLDADLEAVEWERIAAGLHEPNAIRVDNSESIFVFGRNGITKLVRPENGGAVPPSWGITLENHCSDFWQSAETRDFAHSMAIAGDGSFFITKGGQQNDMPSLHSGRALKISPDGKKVEVFASGLRNAYLSIRPGTDEIYASDQQGHWVPATPIHRIVKGGYYGFEPAAPWGVQEPPITPPLCWIPHTVAGSGLGSTWTDAKRFGPLSDSLIYLDFRGPGLLRTYLNDRDGQAATVPIPLKFDFPLLKGAINPIDGQLYLVGFQIWGTEAKKIRGMARVRYTGKKSLLPTRVVAGKNSIVLRFEQELDPSQAEFTVRRWNYKRSGNYGSGHYKPDGKAGEEILAHGGINFSADLKSVLIATPELHPVHQLAISYDLKTATGKSFTNAAYLTLHKTSPLDLKTEGFPEANLKELIAQKRSLKTAEPMQASIKRGSVVYQSIGCAGCHSIDGSKTGKSGPTWKGLAGSKRELQDGTFALADTDFLRESILDPTAKVTTGYNPKDVGMPSYKGILNETDLESLILFIESL